MSIAVTDGIRVEVESFYISERSDPDRDFWFFAYQVQIANESKAPVRLVSRHWVITDGNGGVKEVRGGSRRLSAALNAWRIFRVPKRVPTLDRSWQYAW